MNPIAIPVAILLVKGIMRTVKKAGTAISNLSHSISFKLATIKTPTIISAGAVTSDVTTLSNGEKNRASKNNPAVTTDANPVRPPAPTPVVDSTNDVVVDVPKIAPLTVAAESEKRAFPARGASRLSSNHPVSQPPLMFLLCQRNQRTRTLK